MTGDGINDAPALRRASIGVSMGRGATEVARASAGLVLLDNDFGALVDTVREGRRIYANLQRAFLFLVGFHIPIVGLAIAAPILGLPLLLLPIHLVWLELIVHPVAALMFEGEDAPVGVMDRPPRSPGASVLPGRLLGRSVISGGIVAVAALALYVWRLPDGVEIARGAALTAVIAGGLALTWAERALDQPWSSVPLPRTARSWIVVGFVAATMPVAMLVPGLHRVLQIDPIGLADWGLAIAIAVLAVGWRVRGVPHASSLTIPPTARPDD
jgi:Ca2+-transporting ATPase